MRIFRKKYATIVSVWHKELFSIDRKTCLKLAAKIAAVAIVFTVIVIYYDELRNLDVRALVQAAPSLAVAVLAVLGVYLLKGLVFIIPASIFYLSVGMAFEPGAAVAINLAGILIEITASYLFGLFLGGDAIQKKLAQNKGGRRILELQDNKKNASVFILRLLPIFPIDFVSLFLGGSKYNFLKYLLFSFLGIAPRVILFTLLGDKAYDYIPMNLMILLILAALIGAAVAAVIQALRHKKAALETVKPDMPAQNDADNPAEN